ncbi:hypothetical protein EYF80_020045 [Liparis tanakae]|uniref:Uncharacterized protein n=1 Tax=Liparis tanakae TaxID=230148 RepID=A0A4Z2HVR2_9TELE|nr:hypothetical protein EYF80_020045 [Liparis tanakae]
MVLNLILISIKHVITRWYETEEVLTAPYSTGQGDWLCSDAVQRSSCCDVMDITGSKVVQHNRCYLQSEMN